MTVPAVAGPGSFGHEADVLPFRETPQADTVTAAAIQAAVYAAKAALRAKSIQPGDFALYVAAVTELRIGALYSTAQLAAPAGMTDHQARHAVQRLIKAGLMHGKAVWVREKRGTAAGNRMRYLLTVPR
jgi:hypothetical protein